MSNQNWRKKVASIEVHASFKSAKSGFSKIFNFEYDIARYLNEKKEGKNYTIFAQKSGNILEVKNVVKVLMDIQIGQAKNKTVNVNDIMVIEDESSDEDSEVEISGTASSALSKSNTNSIS